VSAESSDPGEALQASARGLVRELAGRLDLEGVKSALAAIETGARSSGFDAEVTSAVPLTPAESEAIERRLRQGHGAELTVHYRVEPAILGGLIVRVGDRYIDGSVAARLGQLRQTLVGGR
jgi:ATP synthase F1 delta subunit